MFRIKAIQWKRRLRHGAYRQRKQRQLIIVPGDSILFQSAAGNAAVNDYPLLTPPHGYSHRLHDAAARCGAVASLFIQVYTPQTPGAMVAVRRARGGGVYITPTIQAGELSCFIFTFAFRKFFVHEKSPQ